MSVSLQSESGIEYTWFPLDNAAKIFPAVQSKEHTTVFRISVILLERIKIDCLLRAVRKVEVRFHYFKVSLKKGFFWYYLECTDKPLVPVAEGIGLCCAFGNSLHDNSLLYRIVIASKRISVEFSHVLTDGTGATGFLTALLHAYFSELGIQVKDAFNFQLNAKATEQEVEDAYNQYFNSNIPPVIRHTKAFHLPYKLSNRPRFKVLVAQLALDEIKAKAKEKKISITDYLIAIYLFVLQDIHNELPRISYPKKRKILRIQVPVNLRKIYPTRSMRNFSLFVLPEIDLRLGNYTFDEIIKIVHYKMKLETDEKLINKIIARNVGSEKNFLFRGIPLFLKNWILYYIYYLQGTSEYSGVLTNLGKIELPADMMQKIGYFVFIPPPPNKILKINCGVIGSKDKLVISFGNITSSNDLQKKFFRFLVVQGIPVKLIAY